MLDRLRETKLSPDDMADILTVISVEPSVLKTWLVGIDNIRVYGATELLKDYPNDAKNLGITKNTIEQIDEFNNFEPWLIPTIRDAYKSVVRTQFCLKMNGLDDLSQVGAIAFTNDTETADDWRLYGRSEVWTSWAETKGNNAILKGGVKKGKTNFSLLLAEMFLGQGWVVLSNIQVKSPPPHYHYCAKISALLEGICNAKLAKKKVLIIMDEGAMFWAKIDTVLRQNKAMAKLILAYGKCESILLFVSHYQSDIPTIVMKTAVAEFEKLSLKNVFVNIREGIKMNGRLVTSVPATKLEYDPDALQYMTVDLSVDGVFDHISSLPEGMNQWESLLGYLKTHKGEIESELSPKYMAQWLKKQRPDLSENDIAQLTRMSQPQVHRYLTDPDPAKTPE